MGWNPISDISNGFNNVTSQIGNGFNNAAQQVANNPARAGADVVGFGVGGPVGAAATDSLFNNGSSNPSQPGTNPALTQLQQEENNQATTFRQNLAQTKAQQAGWLTQNANKQLNTSLDQINNYNNSRGLLYGGLNAGQKAAQRSASAQGLANQITQNNEQLDTQANNYDQAALATAAGVQAQQQAIVNTAYQNAVAQQNAQNSELGSVIGTAVTAGLILAT